MTSVFNKVMILATIALLLPVTKAHAEGEIKEVPDYFEGFDNVATGKDQLAIGWHRIPDITNLGTIDTYRVEALGGMPDERSTNSQVFSVQYQETWDDETGVSYKTDDLILTPEVKGHVEFWLKYKGQSYNYNTWKPSIDIYKCTDNNDFTYSKGAEITIPEVTIPLDSWVKVSLDVDTWTILGLRLENVYFDSFSADWARIPQVQYLQLTGFGCIDGTTVYTDEKGAVDLNFKINVTNRGNLPIKTTQSNYNIELQNQMQVVGTFPIDTDLEPGQSTEFKFTQPWKLKKVTEAELLSLTCVENISRHASSTSLQMRVEVFAPILGVTCNDAEVKDYIDLGVFTGTKELSLNFTNLGGKELNINSIKVPENIKLDVTAPLTIAPHKTVAVKLTSDAKGAIAGDIVIESDGISPSVTGIHYYGAGVEEGTCYATFDGKTIPSRWLLDKKDAWIGNDRMGEAMRSATSASSMGKLISPLMNFSENGKVTMSLSRWATWTESKLNVYTSTDRQNWTLVAAVSSKDESTVFPESQWSFAAYEVPVGAGDKYIAVEGLYANIDNLTGGKLVDVDHDIYLHEFKADATGMVNYPMEATLKVQNIGPDNLGASDYDAYLLINGEVVSKIEPLGRPALSNTTSAATEIKYSFYPHAAVTDGKLTARLVAGDYVLETEPVAVNIEAEVIDASKVVGTFNADRSGSNIPMRTGDNNSYSEFIYTAEMLQLGNGEKIKAIGFPHKIVADRVAEKKITVWMENTDKERILRPAKGEAFNTADMIKVAEKTVTLTKTTPDGIYSNYTLLNIPLDQAFEYDGRNMRIIVQTTSSAFIASEFLNFAGGNTAFTSSDNPINVATVEADFIMSLPVAVLSLDKAPVAVTGKVVSGTEAIKGAEVKLMSGNVQYSATTDENGQFNVALMQSALKYKATIAASAHKDAAIDETTYPADANLGEIELVPNVVDFNSIAVEVNVKDANIRWNAVTPGSLDTNVTYNVYLDSEKVKDGLDVTECTLEDLAAGNHTVGIAAVFEPSSVATVPSEKEFKIEISGIDTVTGDSVAVNGGKDVILVTVTDNSTVEIYNAAGLNVTTLALRPGTTTIDCAPGIYIVALNTADNTTTIKVAVK